MNGEIEAADLQKSVDFFCDIDSYHAFHLDKQLRVAVGCMDPRDQEGILRTVIQTSGGVFGEGVDAANAMSVERAEPVTIYEGMQVDRDKRKGVKLCGHEACAFVALIDDITSEMANPNDFTQSTLDRWVWDYKIEDLVTPGVLKSIQEASSEHKKFEYKEQDLLVAADNLYASRNVVRMRGNNTAGIYLVNHHPNAGLNRDRKHRVQKLKVQGYHDSVGATLSNHNSSHLPPVYRNARMASVLLRAAAARTVVTAKHPDMVLLEGKMTHDGFKVEKVEAAA